MKSAALELLLTPERKVIRPGSDQRAVPALAKDLEIYCSLPA